MYRADALSADFGFQTQKAMDLLGGFLWNQSRRVQRILKPAGCREDGTWPQHSQKHGLSSSRLVKKREFYCVPLVLNNTSSSIHPLYIWEYINNTIEWGLQSQSQPVIPNTHLQASVALAQTAELAVLCGATTSAEGRDRRELSGACTGGAR